MLAFSAQGQGALVVGSVLVEEWGAFFVEAAAGAEEGEAGGKGDVG